MVIPRTPPVGGDDEATLNPNTNQTSVHRHCESDEGGRSNLYHVNIKSKIVH